MQLYLKQKKTQIFEKKYLSVNIRVNIFDIHAIIFKTKKNANIRKKK
jgi:hypothetical protein